MLICKIAKNKHNKNTNKTLVIMSKNNELAFENGFLVFKTTKKSSV